MNKRGFTLIELLAVIVILSLLALLTSTAVTKLVKDAKEDLSNTQIQLIKSAAESWAAENLMKLPDTGNCGYLTLKDLKNYGLIDSTVLDPKTNQEISDNLKIKISTTTSKYGNPVRNVEVNPESVDGCEAFYIPSCYAVTGDGKKVGDKISCTIEDVTENFYVINNDGTYIEMLTEYNIDLTTYKQSSTAGAIQFSSTNYWSSTATTYPGDVYNDSNDKVKSIVDKYVEYLNKSLTNPKGSLLTYNQVKSLGCNLDNHTCTGAPTWVWSTNYWLGFASDSTKIWYVISDGFFDFYDYNGYGEFGVRPVIKISLADLR